MYKIIHFYYNNIECSSRYKNWFVKNIKHIFVVYLVKFDEVKKLFYSPNTLSRLIFLIFLYNYFYTLLNMARTIFRSELNYNLRIQVL